MSVDSDHQPNNDTQQTHLVIVTVILHVQCHAANKDGNFFWLWACLMHL